MFNMVKAARFPAAAAFGLAFTGSLYWALWSLTDFTFRPATTVATPIVFTPQIRELPPTPKERPLKVQREEVVIDPPAGIEIEGPVIDEVTENPFRTKWVGELTGIAGPERIPLPSGSDREAQPVVRVPPTYPPREAALGIEGWVRVQFDIGVTGAVRNVTAVESEPAGAFDKAAVEAVARWRYNPSIVNGQPVERVGMQTLLRFTLEE